MAAKKPKPKKPKKAKPKPPKFLLVDSCPCPYEVAPQVYMVLRRAGQFASSIYRGEDAKALLHAHGKHTQAEIHAMLPTISNPPGMSEHECRSDGVGKAGPVGRKLPGWQVGVDSGGNSEHDKQAIAHAASSYGWKVEHHYSRGVEGHHWCFAGPPRPTKQTRKQIEKLAAELAAEVMSRPCRC